jgi:phosphatidylglycerophosphatase A
MTSDDNKIALPKSPHTLRDYLAFTIATCGVGFIPVAPGTWGAGVGVGVYWLINRLSLYLALFAAPRGLSLEILSATLLLFITALLLVVGVPAATRVAQILRRDDPGCVVIDEVIGQLFTFICAPTRVDKWTLIGGFLLFRAFDILKPTPARELESLSGGLGIILDDVAAGLYAALALSIAIVLIRLFG